MKVQKLVFALTLTFFTLTGMTASNITDPLTINQCEFTVQLNNTMNEKLRLTSSQMSVIFKFNEDYCSARKNIMNTPNKIGKNTALLASWDKWRIALGEKLTKQQMEKFMQWQSQVDLLGDTPF